MLEVITYLKAFNCYIYTGNQLIDLELMEEELNTLKENKMIEDKQYMNFILSIRKRKRELKNSSHK